LIFTHPTLDIGLVLAVGKLNTLFTATVMGRSTAVGLLLAELICFDINCCSRDWRCETW